MKHYFLIIFFMFNVVFAAPHVTESYSKGKDLSEAHCLPIALVFTGSDWSEPSKTLMDELVKENFSSDLIIVQVDFPDLNSQSKEILSQNHNLKEKFQVESFPTVILLDEKQYEITRLGYPIYGDQSFAYYLKGAGRRYFLLQKRFEEAREKKNRGELKICFDEAKKMGAKVLATNILECGYQDCPELMLEKYIPLIGTKEGADLQKTLVAIEDEEIQKRLALLDFQETHSPTSLEQHIAEFGEKSGDHCWKIHMVLSEYLMGQEKREEALEHAQVSYRYAPIEEKETISGLISKALP